MKYKYCRVKVPEHLRVQYVANLKKVNRNVRKHRFEKSNTQRKCKSCNNNLSATEMSHGRTKCNRCGAIGDSSRLKIPDHLKQQYKCNCAKVGKSINKYRIEKSNTQRKCKSCNNNLSATEMSHGRTKCSKCNNNSVCNRIKIPKHLAKQYEINQYKVKRSIDRYQLNDVYIRNLIHGKGKVKRSDITPEMIDIKRQMMQMLRKRNAL